MNAEDLERLRLIRHLLVAEFDLKRQYVEGSMTRWQAEGLRSELDRKREQLSPTPAEEDFVTNELRHPIGERGSKSIAEQIENAINPATTAFQQRIEVLEELVDSSLINQISALESQISRLSEVKSAPEVISSSSWWRSIVIACSGFGIAIVLVLGFVLLLVGIPTTSNPERTIEVTLDIATLVGAVLGGGGVGVAGVMYGVPQLIDVRSSTASTEEG